MSDVACTSSTDRFHAALDAVPKSVRRILSALHQIEAGTLDVTLPDLRKLRFTGTRSGPHAELAIKSYAFVRRLGAGDVGFAEGYIAGEWDSPDVTAVLEVIACNQRLIDRFSAHPLLRAVQMARHWLNRNSRAGSRRNIHAHYDLGNAFYAAWLDPSMTYSSGLDVGNDLAGSQERKYAAMAAAAGIEAHHHVLEIGCGWGGFAEYAARRIGCRVTALTISEAQRAFAAERISSAGLDHLVTIKLCDYRDEPGIYDRIISIEMFEAVGEAYWTTFFDCLKARLKPQGRAALQVITIREDIFPRYRREMDFIRRYVFPGGMLPTPTILRDLGTTSGLDLTSEREFGLDYAETCKHWRRSFDAAWQSIRSTGFDERFRRIWTYYLAYCEAGFRARTIDVRQIAFVKTDGASA